MHLKHSLLMQEKIVLAVAGHGLFIQMIKNLVIGSTPNQDNPLMDVSELKGFPVMG